MNQYDSVPDGILTGKDLDYLKDMFQWNYIAFKETCNGLNFIQDEKLKDVFESCKSLFDDNMCMIQSIIGNPGGDLDE